METGRTTFREAAEYIKNIPYGYNSLNTNPFVIFDEGKGTCTTKHGLLALCAEELELPVSKALGVYLMTPEIVLGIEKVLGELPGIPALYCFLISGPYRIDLTKGNCNGKNCPIDSYLKIYITEPFISYQHQNVLYNEFVDEYIRGSGAALKNSVKYRELFNKCTGIPNTNLACAVIENT